MNLRIFHILLWMIAWAACAQAQNISWISFLDSATVFSSPRSADLNGDQIEDLIIGGGKEDVAVTRGVAAFNGINGNLLWSYPARNQVYGSAIFQDINQDAVPDIVMVGRSAQLFCLNGANGTLLWEFWPDSLGNPRDSGIYQFYNPQFVPDQNADGFMDLVVTNGGDATKGPLDTVRPPGWLMLISGADGSTIGRDTVPDFKETYHSPLVRQNGAGDWEVLFGTGGERIRGKYFRVNLADLRAGNINSSQILANDSLKGFICPAALVDLSGDALYDIVVPALNGRLLALEGETGALLWEVRKPGFEAYVSPAVGQFTGDPTPDIFMIFARGLWPFYSSFHEVMIDGATGQVVRTDSVDFYQFSTPNVIDFDDDGTDEVLLTRNFNSGVMSGNYNNSFRVRDFNDTLEFQFGALQQGISIFSTPLVRDLDKDGELELAFVWHPVQGSWNAFNGAHLARMGLGFTREEIPWGSYLGTYHDGTYRGNLPVSVEPAYSTLEISVFPNPATGRVTFQVPAHSGWEKVQIFSSTGVLLLESGVPVIDLSALPQGMYLYQVHSPAGTARGRLIKQD